MTSLFDSWLTDATELTRSGHLMEATAAIQRALAGAVGAGQAIPPKTNAAEVLDGLVREVPTPSTRQSPPARPLRSAHQRPTASPAADRSDRRGRVRPFVRDQP